MHYWRNPEFQKSHKHLIHGKLKILYCCQKILISEENNLSENWNNTEEDVVKSFLIHLVKKKLKRTLPLIMSFLKKTFQKLYCLSLFFQWDTGVLVQPPWILKLEQKG